MKIFSDWCNICRNRFCVHIAGLKWYICCILPATKVSELITELINDDAGAKSGWDTFIVQSCIWGGCCEWCYISGAFQCNPKLWPRPNWPLNCFAIYWQFLVSVCHKHIAWSCGNCLSPNNSVMHTSHKDTNIDVDITWLWSNVSPSPCRQGYLALTLLKSCTLAGIFLTELFFPFTFFVQQLQRWYSIFFFI